jgi:superfamily II DNA/RNA helicase
MLPRDCRAVWVAGTKVQVELVPQPRTVVRMQRNRLALTGRQFYISVTDTEECRLAALAALYARVVVPRSLVFCSSDDVADRLVRALSAAGHAVGQLRSDAASEECHATTLDEFT